MVQLPKSGGTRFRRFVTSRTYGSSLAEAGDAYVRSERLLEQQSADLVRLISDLVSRANVTSG